MVSDCISRVTSKVEPLFIHFLDYFYVNSLQGSLALDDADSVD